MSRIGKQSTAFALALTLAFTLTACGGGEERQAKYLERAQQHFDEGHYEKAKIDIKNVLQINANNAEAYYLMAQVEDKTQKWRAVFGNLNKALELEPEHLGANIKMGEIYLLSNDMEKAREQMEKSLALAPNDAAALGLAALVEARNLNGEQAEKYALRSLEADPAQESALSVIASLYSEDEPEKAQSFITKGLVANPESLPIRILKIRFLESQEKTDEVTAEYQTLIEMDPDNTSYIAALAKYYVDKERKAEAEALLRKSIAQNPEDDQLKIMFVRFLASSEDVDTAVAELRAMVKEDPENYVIRELLGSQLAAMGEVEEAEAVFKDSFNYDVKGASSQSARNQLTALARRKEDLVEARRWIDEALEVEPENPQALTNRATLEMLEGDYTQAIPDLRMALRANPESIQALLLLAEAQEKERSINLALDNYRSVLALQPENPVALYRSAAILAGQQNYDQAAANVEKVLEQQPDNILAINLLMEIYSQQERWEDAELLAENLSGNEKAVGVMSLMKASLELRQQNYDEAVVLAKKALAENDQLTGANNIIAQAYAAKGDVAGGIAYVESYLAKNSEDGKLYDTLAQLWLANKDVENARVAYEKAIDVSPKQVQSYVGLARILSATSTPDSVLALYEEGVAANPESILLKTELANWYQISGDDDGALALLEEAYAQDEKSLIVRNNLVSLLLRSPTEENLRRAQAMTEGFESSKNAALLDTLGWLQYQQGNIPQAVKLLLQAQAVGGDGPEYWYHLGMAYKADGQTQLAKELLGKVLSDGGEDFYDRAEAEKAFENL